MTVEILLAVLGGLAGAASLFKRETLFAGAGVVLLALALIAAWLIEG